MNYKLSQVFVATAVDTAAATYELAKQELGVFNPALTSNIGGTTADADFILALGSGSSKFGSFKSSAIQTSNILSTKKTTADTSVKQQVTYVGFDEVTDSKSPSFGCGEEYVLTVKIDEYWSKGIYQPMIQESVRVKTTDCTECGGNCDSLDCYEFMAELASKVNANPLLSKYVTATHVYKGTAPTYKYTLTLPDAGNTTAENTLLAALQAYYPSGTYGTIAITTTDTDGDADADSLGNTLFEIASPLVAIDLMPAYNGVTWEKVQLTAGSVTACGIKLTGNALDEFGNACVPDAVPYVFNLVRFKAIVSEGPLTTQDFDINDIVSPWAVTTTQNIKYPIGAGAAMAEMERHLYANNLPNVHEARRYWNPIYNNDSDALLFVDSSKTYNMYEISYADPSPAGFEKKTTNVHSVIILVDDSLTAVVSALETALNNVLPTALHV